MKKTDEKFPARVRFNWGYHDAVGDKVAGRKRDLVDLQSAGIDEAYYQGYAAGLYEEEYTGNSDAAWNRNTEMLMDIENARDGEGRVRL